MTTLPIHQHLAQESNNRLDFVKYQPKHITLIGADHDISHRLLSQRYPQAKFTEYDADAHRLTQAQSARKISWLNKLVGKNLPQHNQPFNSELPAAAADMIWANLALIRAGEPTAVFDQWSHHLKLDGLLFFTHFGIDSLNELLTTLKMQGIAYEAPSLFDMHDLGDMLFHHGFYDPVMDTAKIELQYHQAATFWQDMEDTGLWQSIHFEDEQAARNAIEHLFQTNQMPPIILESVYGHAIKKQVLPQGESAIQFFPKS